MWILEKQICKQTKQNSNRLIDTENKLMIAKRDGVGKWVEKEIQG